VAAGTPVGFRHKPDLFVISDRRRLAPCPPGGGAYRESG